MKPKDWTPRQRIEHEYRTLIFRLINQYLDLPDHATLGEITEALVNFSNLTKFIQRSAERIAGRMVTQIEVSNARSWREAARRSSRGLEIYRGVQEEMETDVGRRVRELVAENAKLISSIPRDLRAQVNREIAAAQRTGARHEAIASYLQRRIPQLTRSRSNLIARTETSKSAMALTQARAEDMDLPAYLWATSEDARVRDSHRLMDKVIVFWDDPPSPEKLAGERSMLGKYHAGNCPNCRCDAYPLLDVSDVRWPHKCYRAGRIQMMTLARFKSLLGRMAV